MKRFYSSIKKLSHGDTRRGDLTAPRVPSRCIQALLILLVLLASGGPLFGQEPLPRVMVLPFANETGATENDAVARTTTDTLSLTIKLLDAYEYIPVPDERRSEIEPSPATAAAYAEEFSVDSVVFGDVSRDENGAFLFSLSVYDRRSDAVEATTEMVSESLFGVFDAADRLVAEAIGSFSGVRIGFGSIRLRPEEDLRYRVILDGSDIGENVTTIDRVLIGERRIAIDQIIEGQFRRIYSRTIEISEGTTETITFSVPLATEEEIAQATELADTVETRLNSGERLESIPGILDELEEFITVAPDAVPGGPQRVAFLKRRWEIVRLVPQIIATDFGTAARQSNAVAEETVNSISEPLVERTLGISEPLSESEARLLREDIARVARIASHLMVLERTAVPQEDAPAIAALNRMIWELHFWELERRGEIEVDIPYEAEYLATRSFAQDYQHVYERRKPFWHWIIGLIGAGGAGLAAYEQFVEMPRIERDRDDAYADYEAARDVEIVTEARSEVEEGNSDLVFAELLRNVGAGTSVLLPTAIILRSISKSRPNRVWREYEETPFRTALEATSLDYTRRAWESGQPAVLVLGEEESVSGGPLRGATPTPVYIPLEAGESITITHETAPNDAETRKEYDITVEEGLTILYLDGPRE